jgi:signal transduction histidine kinase/CheY-like chemotaxis protein
MLKRFGENRKGRWVFVSGLIILLILMLLVLGVVFYRYTQNSLYDESVSQLKELSNQLFEKMDIQLDAQWDILDKMEELRDPETDVMTRGQIVEFLNRCEDLLAPAGEHILIRAIDAEGNYFTDGGKQGIWTGYGKLNFDMDRQCFVISNWFEDFSYMAFTQELTNPLKVDDVEITHFVVLRTMDDVRPFFHSTAFGDENMTFIIDADGLTLYEDGALEGVEFEGKNIFYAMEEQQFPHMDSFDNILAESMKNITVCTDVVINNNNNNGFYLIYDRLQEYDWGVLILVSADSVAISTAEMVTSMIRVFLIVLGLLLAAAIATFLFIYRIRRDRKIMEIREKNEAALAETNRELEKSKAVTEEALEAAKSATKAKSQFLANMSHDIRTPMNAIVGITKLMEGEIDDRDKLPYYIKKLDQTNKYMLGLINDILDMSKIESGEVSLNLEPVKLAEQVGQIESIIRSQSSERNQDLTILVHNVAHEYLIGDSVRIRQIFLNLMSNAVKYTQDGGKIRMEITELECDVPDHARLLTSVIDNGYGMKKEFLEHIFEPFTREENSVTNKIQGTGLGMAITKNLVDLMGGTISVESEVGKGSRFDVELTLAIDKDGEHNVPVKSVLLISREEQFTGNVKAAFSESETDLRIADSPEEATLLLEEKTADAILLSGYLRDEKLKSVVATLREKDKDAVLVFCCDYGRREHVRDVLTGSGVDGFISRPFFVENLIIAVENAKRDTGSAGKAARSPLGGKRFLCAEDNELNAEILEALLAMHNATCTIYPNGLEIVKAFKNVKPGEYDAILMDVQMPGMNGMEATQAIRRGENPLGRTIPIIAMTANAFSSDVQDCLDAGMDAHLAKPLDITALERTLHEIISGNISGGGHMSTVRIHDRD